MIYKTDLALEATEMINEKKAKKLEDTDSLPDGMKVVTSSSPHVSLTKISLDSVSAAKQIGKKQGVYITIELLSPLNTLEVHKEVSIKTAECLSPFIENSKNNPSIMIIGLGNRNITPDSLGPKVVDKIVVTRHIKSNAQFSQNIDKRLGMVCAIAPGVMGTTGIETGEIIMGLIEKAGPDIVIVIDALCARKTSRVNTTIQISDTGIVPGSGVGNHRMELSKETLGIPVIAIGVPTVVDCSTIAHDLLLSYNESVSEEDLMKKINHSSISDMVVTPKDIDAGISRMSTAISNGINLAVHKGFDFGDISDYLI